MNLRPASSTSRKCKAIWNILTQAGKHCHAGGLVRESPGRVDQRRVRFEPVLRRPAVGDRRQLAAHRQRGTGVSG